MGEGVDGAAYCLLEKEVVDVLQAAFQPDTGEPDGGEGGDDAPGLETQLLAESFPIPLDRKEHRYRQRRHQ